MKYVNFPEEINESDKQKIGGKGFNLAKMIKSGFPVPPCFFVNTEAYHKFLEASKLKEKILERISKIDFSDFNSLLKASEEIRSWIVQASVPEDVKDEIIRAYHRLCEEDAKNSKAIGELFVAVRSSAVTEDIGKASAAGQQETFLNIKGSWNVVEAVKKCWASLFTPRAIYYREQKKLPHDAGMGVVVQKMVNSEKSGVMFTLNPAKPSETNVIVIEAVWGLGETIVQGEVTPDLYIVDKETGEIIEKKTGKKLWERIRDLSGRTVKREVPPERQEAQVLTDQEIITTAALGKKIEEFYGRPQDIEFAVESGKVYIVQARPVTVLAEDVEDKYEEEEEKEAKILLRGLGASPGVATGRVKIVLDLSELDKIEEGDILVTEMTSPDFVPAMEKSAAIITDRGGMTCHAAIVSRELGIPCIVGTGNATKVLKDGMVVTVDATRGVVYEGEVKASKKKKVESESKVSAGVVSGITKEITATKVKVNLAFPETATPEIAVKADGVGLLRLEHMLTEQGMHPVEYIRQDRQQELIKILEEGIGKVAEVFFPKPVWVRSLDARTDEFRHMKGGEKEPKEDNPMLGWHGIRRSIVEKDILKCEFTAIKRLHERGLTNVHIMLPFIISVDELRAAKEIAKECNLPESVKIGIMVETPAAALTIEDFCKEGIAFISFGTNDLTQLTLGVDRNNEKLAKLFNPFHKAVLRQLKMVIDVCREYGVETSICGEAGSNPRMAEILVEFGIDSLSANIDALDTIRETVARKEKRMLLEAARNVLNEKKT